MIYPYHIKFFLIDININAPTFSSLCIPHLPQYLDRLVRQLIWCAHPILQSRIRIGLDLFLIYLFGTFCLIHSWQYHHQIPRALFLVRKDLYIQCYSYGRFTILLYLECIRLIWLSCCSCQHSVSCTTILTKTTNPFRETKRSSFWELRVESFMRSCLNFWRKNAHKWWRLNLWDKKLTARYWSVWRSGTKALFLWACLGSI